jgi:hypothetical protein
MAQTRKNIGVELIGDKSMKSVKELAQIRTRFGGSDQGVLYEL